MLNLKEYREPTDRLPDYLPWAALVGRGVILQKDRILQKTIAFRGHDLASSSGSELISNVARLNNALKRLGSGWAIFVEAQRFEHNEYPDTSWENGAAWLIDRERKELFEKEGAHFESNYFITFVYMLPATQSKDIEAFFYDDPDRNKKNSHAEDNRYDLRYFLRTVGEITDIMSGVFAEVGELDDDQTLSYLHSTVSTHRHQVNAPDVPMYLDALIPDQAFTSGDIPMLGDNFIPTCSISAYPSRSFPGILDDLNHLKIEYRWVTRFICMDREDAQVELNKFRKKWFQKRKSLWTLVKEEAAKQESALVNNDATNKAADADAALQELGEGLASYGYITSTVTTWHTDIDESRRRMQRIKQVIQSNGFTVKDETLNSKEAWFGSLPGHVYANVRRPLINTINLAHIMPISAIWAGDYDNQHLKAVSGISVPHIVCSTTGDTPFYLNLNVSDVGHTTIIGPTGAGKSTLLCMLELQWLKYPDAQIIIFDKDRSARSATLAVNGNYYEPGNNNAPVSFQPLSDIDDTSERIWASQFIMNMLRVQNVQDVPDLKKEIDEALANLASDSKEHRTITLFCALVQSQLIRNALRPYTLEGNFGHLFDADHDDLKSGNWQMIEMGQLMKMGHEAIIPALDYLFHRVEQRLDGRPTLLVLDEAWLFLSHAIFMNQLQNWLKTLRKKNTYVVFATQEITDASKSPIMATILSACHTKIYLPDEEALTPALNEAYTFFGLSETEISLIATAQRKQDYFYKSSKGRRLFNLNLGQVALVFAGMSSDADHRFMDRLIEESKPGDYAAELLRYKGLFDAAETLTTHNNK
jgi:type IV secretion system protein TrbE